MSYILNALRKSERERQAIEPETVTARIVAHQAPRHQRSSRLIAALIVINLAVLVYFLGFTEKTPPVATQVVAPVVKPVEASRAEIMSPPLPVTKSPEPKTPPIAEIVEARALAPATPSPGKPATVTKLPIEAIKPALAPQPITQPAEPSTPPLVIPDAAIEQPIEPVKPALAQPLPVMQNVELARDTIEKPTPVQIKSDLPFLDDLPAEFGRSVPDLPINVFSFSPTPAERFVMIDMVKYVPGQRIKDQLELKEIRPDSIVVAYNGRTFKIRRP